MSEEQLFQKLRPFILGGGGLSGGRGYSFGNSSKKEIENLLDSYVEHGFSAVDLAPIYGMGEAEKRIGQFSKRDKLTLISKSGVFWHENGRVDKSNEPKLAVKMLDIRFTLEVLLKERDKGKILYLGLSNTNKEDLKKANELMDIKFIQEEVNLFSNKTNLLELAKDRYLLGYGTFDKGILTKSVDEKRVFYKEDCRSFAPWWKKEDKSWKYNLIRNISKKELMSLAYYYPKEILKNYAPIIGMRNASHLNEILTLRKKSFNSSSTFPLGSND